MDIKDFINSLPPNINSDSKGLFGRELNLVKELLTNFDIFKGKNIEIIEEVEFGEPNIEVIDGLPSFKQETKPKLITIKDPIKFNETVKLYGIFVVNGDLMIRCTEDSI